VNCAVVVVTSRKKTYKFPNRSRGKM